MSGLTGTQESSTQAGPSSSPIAESAALIEKEVLRLREVITALEGRLISLLIEPQPRVGQEKEKVRPQKSTLLVFMEDTESTLRSQRCRIESILERLQV